MHELETLLRGRQPSEIRVALDVEEVLAAIALPVLSLYNQINGTSYVISDVKDWRFKSINSSVSEMMPLFNKVWLEQYQNIGCYGDLKLMSELCREYSVDIVTGRVGTDNPLKKWLAINNLQGIPLVIHPPRTEKTVLGYNIFIDDSPLLADEVIKTPSCVQLLVIKPWNEEAIPKHERIIRVSDVNEAAILLIRVARKEREATKAC